MKGHQVITIDQEYLTSHKACGSGIDTVSHLLPARLSTDPERNYTLAANLMDLFACTDVRSDLDWLYEVSVGSCPCNSCDHALNDGEDRYDDIWRVAQILAMIADAIATKAGR